MIYEIVKYCLMCKLEFIVSFKYRDKRKFCSQICANMYNCGNNCKSWKGGKPRCVQCNKIMTSYHKSRKRCMLCVNRKGKNNPNWKGNNIIYDRDRQSIDYKLWRESIFKRDNFTCQLCNKYGGYLEAHHIKQYHHYKDLRFDINNGITLCKKCHNKTKKRETVFENRFHDIIRNNTCPILH